MAVAGKSLAKRELDAAIERELAGLTPEEGQAVIDEVLAEWGVALTRNE